MPAGFSTIIPVLPSADISRDIDWYKTYAGFETLFADRMYAVLYRETLVLHLQWHAGTPDDPLNSGSVIRIDVTNIEVLLEEFIERGTITRDQYRTHTPWNTKEFGFFDLNRNAVFIMEDL